jgi:protein TonB
MRVGASAWGGMRDVSPTWELPRVRAVGTGLRASRPIVITRSGSVRWQRILLSFAAHAAVLTAAVILVSETVPPEPLSAVSTFALVYAPAESATAVSPPPIPAAPPVPVPQQLAPPEVPTPPTVAHVIPPQPEPSPAIAQVPAIPSVAMEQPTIVPERMPLPPVPPPHPPAPRRAVAAATPQPVPPPPTTEAAQPAPQAQPAVAAAGPSVPARPVTGMASDRPPVYPEIARRRGEQGRVLLRVNVSADGRPIEVDVAQTSGYPTLDEAAQSAVRHWRFVPAMQAGAPIEAVADVPVRFRLDN